MRTCSKCGTDKAADQFSKGSRRCRDCIAIAYAEWYAKTDTPERRASKVVATAKWRLSNRDKRQSYQAKRRAITHGATAEMVDRLVVYERDDYRCWICGEMTDPDAEAFNLRPSLDHVMALVDGGSHTYANLRCAHRGCNTRRGALRRHERDRIRKAGGDVFEVDVTARLAPRKVKVPPKDPNRQKPGATHCRNGHLLDEENTMHVDGRRRCRICGRAKQKRLRDAKVLTTEKRRERAARAVAFQQSERGRELRRAWVEANKDRVNAERRAKRAAMTMDERNARRRERRDAERVAHAETPAGYPAAVAVTRKDI